ncbi:hypothetical protein G5I_11594 [Acromyrmex echinatior]|uniref:Uncharacterized protein n=1 Tax=Acromyrmex echinatior TaxID=103372 RepID=F4X012_ACREC|nr:hypothetical protein G5I_11594 [Acromyrmex echinatior]
MQGLAVGPYKKSNEVLPRHAEHSPVTGAGQNVRRPCRGAVISHLMSITSSTRKILSRYTTHACRYYIAVRDRMRAIRITALAARENEDSGRWHITSSPLNKTCQRPRKYKIVGYMRDGIKFHQALLLSVTGSFIAPHLQHQTAPQPPQVHFVIFWYDKLLLKLCYHLLLFLYCFVAKYTLKDILKVQGGTVYHRVLLPAVRLPYEANIDEIFFPNYANPFRD